MNFFSCKKKESNLSLQIIQPSENAHYSSHDQLNISCQVISDNTDYKVQVSLKEIDGQISDLSYIFTPQKESELMNISFNLNDYVWKGGEYLLTVTAISKDITKRDFCKIYIEPTTKSVSGYFAATLTGNEVKVYKSDTAFNFTQFSYYNGDIIELFTSSSKALFTGAAYSGYTSCRNISNAGEYWSIMANGNNEPYFNDYYCYNYNIYCAYRDGRITGTSEFGNSIFGIFTETGYHAYRIIGNDRFLVSVEKKINGGTFRIKSYDIITGAAFQEIPVTGEPIKFLPIIKDQKAYIIIRESGQFKIYSYLIQSNQLNFEGNLPGTNFIHSVYSANNTVLIGTNNNLILYNLSSSILNTISGSLSNSYSFCVDTISNSVLITEGNQLKLMNFNGTVLNTKTLNINPVLIAPAYSHD